MKKELEVTVSVSKTPIYYIGYVVAWIGDRILGAGLWLIVKGMKTKLQ